MKEEKDLNKISIKKEKRSSLAKFTERPLPNEEEVSNFEKTVSKGIREDEIEDSLSEIYQDKKGELIDVSDKSFKKKKSWFLIIFKNLIFLVVLASAIYLIYYYLNSQYLNKVEVDLEIIAPNKVMAGEDFSYQINYHNNSSVVLEDVNLEIIFPDSFVFLESSPDYDIFRFWSLDDLLPGQSAQVVVTGRLLNTLNSPNPVNARLNYMPANFSSKFSQETNANTIIDSLGFEISTNFFNTALVGQESVVNFSFVNFVDNKLDDLILSIDWPDNFSLISLNKTEELTDSSFLIEEIGLNKWRLSDWLEESERLDFDLKFRVDEKINDKELISVNLFDQSVDKKERLVWGKKLDFEIMESDLSLSLEINDDKNNQTINFGDKLNYSLIYHNKGQAVLKDLVLMVVIEGEMIEWESLESTQSPLLMDSVLVWTKDQIPELANLDPDEQGNINFSLLVKDFQDDDFGQDLVINSWSQFSFGLNDGDIKKIEDNQSNFIEKRINSNLTINEEIRYFDDNNVPVGSGPLPPQTGQETSFRVYWTINNSLHELEDIKISLKLPDYIKWKDRLQANTGQLKYNEENNEMLWLIDAWPLSAYRLDAEFNLSLTPSLEDKDKILIISPGVRVEAKDVVTGGKIDYKSSAKTTKLEDDEIAIQFNTGRVQ
jgi:hypothetical protein